MNELETEALNCIRSNKLAELKKLPKEMLNFRNNMLIYRAIAEAKFACFKYLMSIKEINDIFDAKHALLLTVYNHNEKILEYIIKIIQEKPISLNKKENTHLLEKILKNRENCIETDEKTYLKYVDTNNLNFSKVIFSYAIFNKDLYYLKLMYKADKIAFIEFCNSKTVLQKAVNNIESKNNYINNEIFKLNNSFYKQILNYVKKDYNQSFYNDIKSKININLMKLNMDAF